jgi:response regulator RpfG family c-di-GMP phosphodiesterase
MPRKDGFEVLQWLRQHRQPHTLRVVVLTSSEELSDVNTAYSLDANSFLVKPLDFESFIQLAHFITYCWLRLSKCPATTFPGLGQSRDKPFAHSHRRNKISCR